MADSYSQVLDGVLSTRIAVVVAISAVSKWLITTLAGVDFMIAEIARQRVFDIYLQQGSWPAGTEPGGCDSSVAFQRVGHDSTATARKLPVAASRLTTSRASAMLCGL